ncbi:MAG: hypothetical protein ACKVQS_01045 [Fimbriimonadaceae bacterium]
MKLRMGMGLAVGLGFAGIASATSLTFANVSGGPVSTLQLADYGDRVTSAVMGDFSYGADQGFTPNVVADYGDGTATWGAGYGSFSSCIWNQNATSANTSEANPVRLTLTADAGFLVRLHSLNLADWSGSTNDQTTIQVLDGGNTVLNTLSLLPDTTTFTALDYTASNLVASSLTITWNNAWHTGGSDIVFSQEAVPEPVSLFVISGLAVAVLRRNRK